jgi:hypothetical protein
LTVGKIVRLALETIVDVMRDVGAMNLTAAPELEIVRLRVGLLAIVEPQLGHMPDLTACQATTDVGNGGGREQGPVAPRATSHWSILPCFGFAVHYLARPRGRRGGACARIGLAVSSHCLSDDKARGIGFGAALGAQADDDAGRIQDA